MFNKSLLCAVFTALTFTGLSLSAGNTLASIPADEAAKLGGSQLTPVGAERAGNADGSIPEWTGGLGPDAMPADWKRGQDRPNFFADEQPLFTITAANMAQYDGKLTEGMKALLKQYPEFSMPVYPSHRTAAWPQYVYDSTKEQATNAQLAADGNGISNVWGALPFPIPKNGNEVIWNHNTRFLGKMRTIPNAIENTIYNSGQRLDWGFENKVHFTYYDPNVTDKDRNGGVIFKYASTTLKPSRDAGEGILALENIDAKNIPRKAWTYDPGERRVRRAPNLAFDTPDRPVNTVDDYDMFSGSPERYNWKLVGKQEIYVPYNNNELNKTSHDYKTVYTTPVIKSDLTRYELHRVWVLEATLREDARHVYSKRTMYIDEDTWTILATDKYDGNGNLWRVGLNYPVTAAEVPVTAGGFYIHYDLKVGAYYTILGVQGMRYAQTFDDEPPKSSFYTPAAVRRRGK